MKQSTCQFHKMFFHISKCLASNAEKTLQFKVTKIRMNIANLINIYIYIYIQIYILILYVTRMTQNKNDSINLILKYGRVVDKNCCVPFPTSGFPYLTLCRRQCISEGRNHLLIYKD